MARGGEGSHCWRLVSSLALTLLPFLRCTPWKMANNSLDFPAALTDMNQLLMLSQEVLDQPVTLAFQALQLPPPGVAGSPGCSPSLHSSPSHPQDLVLQQLSSKACYLI